MNSYLETEEKKGELKKYDHQKRSLRLEQSTGVNTKTQTKEILNYTASEILGSGSFGIVYKAECIETKEIVAIKKVLQDKRYKNRELQILKELDHPNVIRIKQFFYTPAENDNLYLNVVMDYVPETLARVIRNYSKPKQEMPLILVKIYAYQILKSINYIHLLGICHRDIKPQNILIDHKNYLLKLCDFGSAKKLMKGEMNVAYICSRYYRAPELILGASEYTNAVDVWSVGCVLAEFVLLEPLFQGENSIDQIVEIVKVLGTPNKKQISAMNPQYTSYKFPVIKCYSLKEIFKSKNNACKEFIDLLSKILVYEPDKRITPLEALSHPFFNELKEENKTSKIVNGGISVPSSLFEFSEEELNSEIKHQIRRLIPDWYTDL